MAGAGAGGAGANYRWRYWILEIQVAVNNKQTRVQTKVPVVVKPIELEGIHHTDHTDPLFSNQLGDLTKQTLELLLLS